MTPRKARISAVQEMKNFINDTMESLGAKMVWKPDTDLRKFKRGQPLLLKELRKLPYRSPVWVTWREFEEKGFRINRAMWALRDEKSGPDYWILSDGSSFGTDFSAECGANQSCYDSKGGVGEMFLYVAEPKTRRKSAGSARTGQRR